MLDDELDLVFKALAHTERRRILLALREKPDQSLFEICAGSFSQNGQALSRQTVSQHLDMLERAGLIEIIWEGRTKMHSICKGPLQTAIKELSNDFT